MPDMTKEQPVCYLTTTGRRTHRPHEIEIWFARQGHTLYLLSGGRDTADWGRTALPVALDLVG